MPGKISQTITTISGIKYTLSFFIGAHFNANSVVTLDVSIAGLITQTTFDGTGKGRQNVDWEFRSIDFVATSATTEIIFSSTLYGPIIDDITVTLPSTFFFHSFFFCLSFSFILFLSFFPFLFLFFSFPFLKNKKQTNQN